MASVETITGVKLDHVAHAVPRWQDVWHRYATDLGAEWNSGGPGPGFAPAQLRFGNDGRVEVLKPWRPDVNDFLERFLAASGPGAHHVTFKVPSLTQAIEQARSHGYEPIGINMADPEWMECFIHPKQAGGIVVQLAEQPVPWTNEPPAHFPRRRRPASGGTAPAPPASLRWVVHVVDDLEVATRLFGGLLGGEITDEGERQGVRWRDFRWPSVLGIRLLASASDEPAGSVTDWLDGRPGRVHHLAFTLSDPGDVPGARKVSSNADPILAAGVGNDPAGDGPWIIPANENHGLMLVLTRDTPDDRPNR